MKENRFQGHVAVRTARIQAILTAQDPAAETTDDQPHSFCQEVEANDWTAMITLEQLNSEHPCDQTFYPADFFNCRFEIRGMYQGKINIVSTFNAVS